MRRFRSGFVCFHVASVTNVIMGLSGRGFGGRRLVVVGWRRMVPELDLGGMLVGFVFSFHGNECG